LILSVWKKFLIIFKNAYPVLEDWLFFWIAYANLNLFIHQSLGHTQFLIKAIRLMDYKDDKEGCKVSIQTFLNLSKTATKSQG